MQISIFFEKIVIIYKINYKITLQYILKKSFEKSFEPGVEGRAWRENGLCFVRIQRTCA